MQLIVVDLAGLICWLKKYPVRWVGKVTQASRQTRPSLEGGSATGIELIENYDVG
jgi:hypothetical protein